MTKPETGGSRMVDKPDPDTLTPDEPGTDNDEDDDPGVVPPDDDDA